MKGKLEGRAGPDEIGDMPPIGVISPTVRVAEKPRMGNANEAWGPNPAMEERACEQAAMKGRFCLAR